MSVRDQRAKEFELLRLTGGMTVLDYEMEFTRLSKYLPILVATETSKAKRFVKGLRVQISRLIHYTKDTSFAQVVDEALRKEALMPFEKHDRPPKKEFRPQGYGGRPWYSEGTIVAVDHQSNRGHSSSRGHEHPGLGAAR